MLLTEEFPGWLYAVNLGATTVWERWNSLEADGSISGTGMNSLNHYAYGSVCEAVYSRIMGLRNAAPGWKKALIAPKISGKLRTSSICFDSPAGTWKVSWQILSDGKVTLAAEVPSGASAHIVLPDHPEGLETDVESGSYEWTWTPEVDYLHPFSIESRMMDLLDNPEAAKIVKEHVPALYNACGGHDNDMRVMPPMQVAEIIPMDRDAIRRMDPLLRKVAI